MPISPLQDAEGVLRTSLKTAGSPLPDSMQVISLEIRRALGAIPGATLVIANDDPDSDGKVPADQDRFAPGAEIRIAAGYGDGETELFVGIVVKIALRCGAGGDCRLVIDCRDRAVAMTASARNAVFVQQKDSDILRHVATRHGLSATIDATATVHDQLVQYRCTDWDFLVARAQANGLLLTVVDGEVTAKAPQIAEVPELSLTWGVDLMDFSAEMDAHDGMRGRMQFQGSALARVGGLVRVAGFGSRFGGDLRIRAVEHHISDGNWVTTTACGLAPEESGQRAEVIAPARTDGVHGLEGLQVGVVVRLDGDPSQLHRILVQLPICQGEQPILWARVLQFQASSSSGAFFFPEIGDEVLVGFVGDDPFSPVVFGALYNSSHKPPCALEPGNHTKALVTRCGHRIELDDEDRTISVTTPAGNRFQLSDNDRTVTLQDETGNKVVLSPEGVLLDTPRDLRIVAKGRIDLEATGPVSVQSQADVACKGLNVACEARIGFIGKGAATAELAASGQTTVKGAMVMIN